VFPNPGLVSQSVAEMPIGGVQDAQHGRTLPDAGVEFNRTILD
jgi:hypothetical protein